MRLDFWSHVTGLGRAGGICSSATFIGAAVAGARTLTGRALFWCVLALTASFLVPGWGPVSGWGVARAQLLGDMAPGPYTSADPADFADVASLPDDVPWVGTYYFYWYDSLTGYHLIDPDGTDALQDHPVDLQLLSWRNVDWHKQELAEMAAVGIDVVLPVYWGSPRNAGWTHEGLKVMVEALVAIEEEGGRAPKVGMFFDTTAITQVPGGADLTTEQGKSIFYRMIRDFFSVIPPRFWAAVDGQPLVFLYASGFASRYDATLFPYVKEQFAREFGGLTPYIVAEVSWTVPADSKYRWGAALSGPSFFGVAAVGPGYNDSTVPGRTTSIRDREDGAFYTQSWMQVLARRPKAVVIETWNEFHEGTEITETREYGRLYLDLTAQFVRQLKEGVVPELPPSPYAEATQVWTRLGESNEEYGLKLVFNADGLTKPDEARGEAGLRPVPNPYGGFYLYFQIDDGFMSYVRDQQAVVKVRYFDDGRGQLWVQYDSKDPLALLDGAYKSSAAVTLTGSGEWKEASFLLPDPFFAGRQNAAADFRLAISGPVVIIQEVRVERVGERVGE